MGENEVFGFGEMFRNTLAAEGETLDKEFCISFNLSTSSIDNVV